MNENSEIFLPRQVGIASDLVFIIDDSPGYLANCLLVHDEVVIPLNNMTLSSLEIKFGSPGLYKLINEGRIRFCPSFSTYSRSKEDEEFIYSEDNFFNEIRDNDRYKGESDRDLLFEAIQQGFIRPNAPDYKKWIAISRDAEQAFIDTGRRKGYEWLYEGYDPISGRKIRSQDRITGLITGIARINDLTEAGVMSMEMDSELPVLLEIGFPVISSSHIAEDCMELRSKEIMEKLHKIEGLPFFASHRRGMLRTEEDIDQLIKTILSDESTDLRIWLRNNIGPNLDVREAYDKSELLLPSKRKWTNWIRFGMSSGAGVAMGLLATGHPIGAAVAGVAIGASDLAWGEAITAKVADPYHPKKWLSHMRRSTL